VVIVGAGFAGLSAAKALIGEAVDVTVVDQRNFHTFQPMLYEVATAGLDSGDVAYPIRVIFGKARTSRSGSPWSTCGLGPPPRHARRREPLPSTR